MIYKNITTWQAERAAMIPKAAGLPLDPSSGDVGHIDNHTVVHELLAEYVFDLEVDSQIWKKTADNEWSGIDSTPSYDDSGLQDYLQEIEDFFIQSYGASPMFYLVADLGWVEKEYAHPSEMPVGSTLYSGQKGLLGVATGLAVKSERIAGRVEILDDENHARRDEIFALTPRIGTLEDSNGTLSTTVSDLEADVSTLTADKETLEGKVSTLESDNSTLNATVSTLESDSATLNTTVSQLGEDVATLSNANSTLEGQVSTLESDNVSLNTTVSGLETDLGSLSSANDTLSSTVSTLEGNVATLTSDKEALEGQVSTLESTIGDLTSRLEALEASTSPE